ncbi:2-phosphosulfolactate phosphatase [Methanocella arvoryzae]|uniref:2-phosphosulfolactate phosphatase n=1 Tax=Methanocella arvoryzae (strain DSM 22066 / NBRC 105507 / MRE50) TaxID=351160 RepID=Q0W6F9_METAR|nr:2-phosphosulfolactate phosphatase [Methanocella arvoryzae]CAJ36034.1 putative 2-phosphosulfolactate phosphatase [Methanocella arvoryzae MRE50]
MKCYTGPAGKADFLKAPEGLPVIIDVLRASSTIIVALASGARKVIPVEDEAEALRLGRELGAITIGERQGIKIKGFDHGNSPTELMASDLKGRTVVITTTNGTRVMVEGGIIASTLNAGAVADRIRSQPHAYLLASGSPLKSDEDLCAALLIENIAGRINGGENPERAVQAATESLEGKALLEGIRGSASGRKLTAYGSGRDVEMICTEINTYPLIPVYRNGAITLL